MCKIRISRPFISPDSKVMYDSKSVKDLGELYGEIEIHKQVDWVKKIITGKICEYMDTINVFTMTMTSLNGFLFMTTPGTEEFNQISVLPLKGNIFYINIEDQDFNDIWWGWLTLEEVAPKILEILGGKKNVDSN